MIDSDVREKSKNNNIIRIGILLSVIFLTVYLYSIREQLVGLERYGYPGIFIVSVLANATIIVPLPGVIVTSAMGAIFNPFWVGIAAGSGAAIGEIAGYLAGYSGQGVIEKTKWSDRLFEWMGSKYGNITILLLAFIPNPLFDMAGIIAGALKMRWHRFLFWCMLGKILKMLMLAYGGATILKWFGL